MACTRTYATLRIFSEVMSPDKIEKHIGLISTKSLPRDLSSKYTPRRDQNYWSKTTKDELDSTDNIKHIKLLLEYLKGKEDILSSLRSQGCSTDIFCYWDSNGQGGPNINIELMKDLVCFGLGISWDIYFNEENA